MQMLATIQWLFGLVQHPRVLVVAAVMSIPALFPLTRYFFEDFASFKRDVGLDNSVGRFAWLIGSPLEEYTLYFRIIGFLGGYVIFVAAIYQFLLKVGGLFHTV